MSGTIVFSDYLYWFGHRSLLNQLIDDYYEKYEGDIAESVLEQIYAGEGNKLFNMSKFNPREFMRWYGVVQELTHDIIKVDGKHANFYINKYYFKINLIELESPFLLDERLGISKNKTLKLKSEKLWVAPLWVFEPVTKLILVDLQEAKLLEDAKILEDAWLNDLGEYDISIVSESAQEIVVKSVKSWKYDDWYLNGQDKNTTIFGYTIRVKADDDRVALKTYINKLKHLLNTE